MRDQVFISYSHADKRWLDKLTTHLGPFMDGKTVSYWDDRKIKAGRNWRQEIDEALSAAKVAVLLVTPNFLASDFIKEHELPYLHEAAQNEELKIIWIAIKHSAYSRTVLEFYQAANAVDQPLASLPAYERDKILYEVCEKIESAMGPALSPAKPTVKQPPRRKNPLAHKQCNRTRYLSRFERFLQESLTQRAGLPVICVVHGMMGECHDSFTDRLYLEVIKPYADNERGRGQRNGIRRSKNDLGWPEYEGEASSLQEDAQGMLAREFTGSYRMDFPAATLTQLSTLSKFRFVIVQHTIHLTKWTETAKGLVDWYLKTYWGTLAAAPGVRQGPQFIVILKITYPAPGLLGSLMPFAAFDREIVKKDLKQINDSANQQIPSLLLDELAPPPYTEVYRWMTDQKIFQDEEDRLNAAVNIYRTYGDKITMALIEKELGKHIQL